MCSNFFPRVASLSLLVVWLPSGCAHMNHAQSGALLGSGAGAIVGSAIGSHNGNTGAGALIGGVTGAMAGGILGDAEDAREERDAAYLQRDAAVAQAQHLAQTQQGLTNFDLIRLSQSGISDDVIVNMINTRGGHFELTTEAIIALKSNGVSDRVIVAAQTSPLATQQNNASMAASLQPGVVVVPPPPAVVVEAVPAPIIVGGGWHHYHPYHRYPYRRPGSSVGFFFGL